MGKTRSMHRAKKSPRRDNLDDMVDVLRRENKRNLKRRKRQVLRTVRRDKH